MSPGPDRTGWGYRDHREEVMAQEAAGKGGGCAFSMAAVMLVPLIGLAMGIKMGSDCICNCKPCKAARRGSIWASHCGVRSKGCPK